MIISIENYLIIFFIYFYQYSVHWLSGDKNIYESVGFYIAFTSRQVSKFLVINNYSCENLSLKKKMKHMISNEFSGSV